MTATFPLTRDDQADRSAALPPAELCELAGRIVMPADPDFDSARQAWNLAIDQRPEFVVQVAVVADIIAVVRYARANGLRVAPQGTGHNAAPLGDLTGTILLRTDLLREVTVDAAARVVRVGAGVLWQEVTDALAPHGLTARAGSSPDVGVVGYTLGGGYSWLSRQHGLAVSAVTAVEIVTGDGTFHRVDATHEPELFWAVRGGGGNGCIVSAIEFGVLPLSTVYAGNLFFPLERAGELLRAHAEWTKTAPDAATTCIRLLRLPPLPELPEFLSGKSLVVIDGAIDGPVDEAAAILAPLRALGPMIDTFAEMPTAGLGLIHMDPPTPVPAAGDGMIIDELTDDAVEALLAVAGPGTESALLMVDLRQLGGAVGRPATGGGAVDHFPGQYLLFTGGMAVSPEATAAVRRDLASLRSALSPWMSDRDYSNFREAAAPAARFWAADTLARLVAVVNAVDPDRVVRSAHSVD
ncbi:MAG: FAD-dependent oxidoreductase [Nakamurella sp.]